jgi:hypothetical protein
VLRDPLTDKPFPNRSYVATAEEIGKKENEMDVTFTGVTDADGHTEPTRIYRTV